MAAPAYTIPDIDVLFEDGTPGYGFRGFSLASPAYTFVLGLSTPAWTLSVDGDSDTPEYKTDFGTAKAPTGSPLDFGTATVPTGPALDMQDYL